MQFKVHFIYSVSKGYVYCFHNFSVWKGKLHINRLGRRHQKTSSVKDPRYSYIIITGNKYVIDVILNETELAKRKKKQGINGIWYSGDTCLGIF